MLRLPAAPAGAIPTPPGTPATPAAPATDKTGPTIRLSHVRNVRRPRRTTIRGRVTDASGVGSVTVSFGDGKRVRARLSSSGRFTITHRYTRAKKFRLTIAAVDRAGNRTTRRLAARVLARR